MSRSSDSPVAYRILRWDKNRLVGETTLPYNDPAKIDTHRAPVNVPHSLCLPCLDINGLNFHEVPHGIIRPVKLQESYKQIPNKNMRGHA